VTQDAPLSATQSAACVFVCVSLRVCGGVILPYCNLRGGFLFVTVNGFRGMR
jgi:hypothetical protein